MPTRSFARRWQRPEIYKEEIVRNEMFLHLDYYVTESSGHNSEYNWWFRKRPDLIEKYCTARHRLEPRRLRADPGMVSARRRHLARGDRRWLDKRRAARPAARP